MESENKLQFVVRKEANKSQIKKELEGFFKIKIKSIKTFLDPRGRKKATAAKPKVTALQSANKKWRETAKKLLVKATKDFQKQLEKMKKEMLAELKKAAIKKKAKKAPVKKRGGRPAAKKKVMKKKAAPKKKKVTKAKKRGRPAKKKK